LRGGRPPGNGTRRRPAAAPAQSTAQRPGGNVKRESLLLKNRSSFGGPAACRPSACPLGARSQSRPGPAWRNSSGPRPNSARPKSGPGPSALAGRRLSMSVAGPISRRGSGLRALTVHVATTLEWLRFVPGRASEREWCARRAAKPVGARRTLRAPIVLSPDSRAPLGGPLPERYKFRCRPPVMLARLICCALSDRACERDPARRLLDIVE
jgi:hypothetical protein